ncbi:hypothetical protein [Mycolicibacterium wolinskyi]|uniref:hypothetical protein n=1 Tax=Mycolicibacterium wolinskyi TaxID=59750 RepID=UPI0039177D80
MARVAKSTAFVKQHDYSHIIKWYRETLPKADPPRPSRWEPVRIGPTWDWDPQRGWLFPEHSMGWELLGWCGYWLRDMAGQEWQFTPEQARFFLHYEAIDDDGRLLHRTGVLQRLKGWGKDPAACALACSKAFAPVIFDHWGPEGPVGRDDPAAWVQISAVSKKQTANTMKLFPVMLSEESRRHYGIQIGRDNVWGLGDTRQIEATASNYLAIEGNRVTQAIRNEPQNWNDSNQGHDLAGAIDGNSTKIPDGLGRILDIQNAYRPGDDSVAQRAREAWEATQATEERGPTARSFGMLVDSLEAHPEAPLTADAAPEVLESVRGDSVWLDIPAMVESILNGSNTPSESRRKWYNQVVAAADAWTTAQQFDACYRDETPDKGEPILMFGDGSKSDDTTAVFGIRISDGMVFPIGIWAPKKVKEGGREINLPIDRAAVDRKVRQYLDDYDVWGFWFDPSDARDDETGERYWEPYCDAWARDYARKLRRLPAVKTGTSQHLVIWDMRNPIHVKLFTEVCGRTLTDLDDKRMFHNCPPPSKPGLGVLARQHVLNMRRRPNKFGVSVGKEHRESRKKIDAGVCMIGARVMWLQLTGKQKSDGKFAPGKGRVLTRR